VFNAGRRCSGRTCDALADYGDLQHAPDRTDPARTCQIHNGIADRAPIGYRTASRYGPGSVSPPRSPDLAVLTLFLQIGQHFTAEQAGLGSISLTIGSGVGGGGLVGVDGDEFGGSGLPTSMVHPRT